MDFPQFKRALEVAGNALKEEEAMFLFSFWDSCAGQQEPTGIVPVMLAVDDLVGSMQQYTGTMFKSGQDPLDKAIGGGNKSNQSSLGAGGIFGGGAFEADARGGGKPAMPSGAPAMMQAPPQMAQVSDRPRGNNSSIPGGIFGGEEQLANAPPSSRGGGNKSNQSSIQGGIFGEQQAPSYQPKANKPYSNASSIPGGIFG